MDMGLMIWLGAATLGAAAAAGFLVQLRSRLTARIPDGSKTSAWQRGRSALLGLTLSLVTLGLGLGGTVTTIGGVPQADRTEGETREAWDDDRTSIDAGTVVAEGAEAADTTPHLEAALDDTARGQPAEGTENLGATEGAGDAGATGEDRSLDTTDRTSSVSAPASTSTGDGDGDGQWAVRVGVFGVESNVRSTLEELQEAGMSGFVVTRTRGSGRELTFVYAGRAETRAAAEAMAVRVRAVGLEALVVDFQPPA